MTKNLITTVIFRHQFDQYLSEVKIFFSGKYLLEICLVCSLFGIIISY